MNKIYKDNKIITLPYSISYNDINKICKELNLPKTIGNVIDLPMNESWAKIMKTNSAYNIVNDIKFHNIRRIIFYIPNNNLNGIIKFSTDYSLNKESVLTYKDVQNIINAVNKINHNKICEIFIDPISLEILDNPIIASDGITYSQKSLEQLFTNSKPNNPISPITRKELQYINGEYGLKNKLINEVKDLFKNIII